MRHFDLEDERVKRRIVKLNAKKVLIQLPEGLKPEAPRIAESIEKLGVETLIAADPCYGACDLATADAENLGVDLLIHYGHSKLVKHESIPTIYVETLATLSIASAVRKALRLLAKRRRIGLTTSIQHSKALNEAREILTCSGKTVLIGDSGRLGHPGQVIGCDYSNAISIAEDADAFLFVGGGKFHALGIALSTSKPTIVADPFENRAFSIDEEAERIVKQRWASVSEAKKARAFGIIVGLKPGQKHLEEARQIKKSIEKKGKNAYLLSAREITPESLMEFPSLDAFINTACPRVSIDDATSFKKPILTLNEARVLVGEVSWDQLCRKGLLAN